MVKYFSEEDHRVLAELICNGHGLKSIGKSMKRSRTSISGVIQETFATSIEGLRCGLISKSITPSEVKDCLTRRYERVKESRSIAAKKGAAARVKNLSKPTYSVPFENSLKTLSGFSTIMLLDELRKRALSGK